MAISIKEHNWPWEAQSHRTYDVYFFSDHIFTTVTNDPTQVSDWISDLKFFQRRGLRLIVGLHVQWLPSSNRRNVRNTPATLQLCVFDRCLIYQIFYTPHIPQTLADFLADYCNIFVGVNVKSDLEMLEEDYGIGGKARCVDLRSLAADAYGRKELRDKELKELAGIVLAREVEKPQQVTESRWDSRWLTAEQVQYACADAFVSFEIGRVLNASCCIDWSYRQVSS